MARSGWRKMMVELREEDIQQLDKLADEARRTSNDQAAILIEEALKERTSWQAPSDNQPSSQETVDAVVSSRSQHHTHDPQSREHVPFYMSQDEPMTE